MILVFFEYFLYIFAKNQTNMKYTAIIKKTPDGWFIGQCEQIPEALTQGKSIEEVKENLKDAIRLCLEYKNMEASQNKKVKQKNAASKKSFFVTHLNCIQSISNQSNNIPK